MQDFLTLSRHGLKIRTATLSNSVIGAFYEPFYYQIESLAIISHLP